MLSWISANLVNILLVAVIALAVALAVRGILRNKKTGACSCGGACAACQGCGRCAAPKADPAGRDAHIAPSKREPRGADRPSHCYGFGFLP